MKRLVAIALALLALVGVAMLLDRHAPAPHNEAPSTLPVATQEQKIPALEQPAMTSGDNERVADHPMVIQPTPAGTVPMSAVQGEAWSTSLPVGDGRYSLTAPKKGYVYLCHENKGGGGAQVTGSWIHGTTWNPSEKIAVRGDVAWPNASLTMSIANGFRTIATNDLPKSHTTGTFPVAASDPASAVDRNPNAIKSQSLDFQLPIDPTMLATPACVGGEVGIMTSGVMLFNAFDAELRDADAHEVQDHCDGHPQGSGLYHYHGLSSCMKDTTSATVIGYAFDGFPITGPKVAENAYLFTKDLDECHGMTSPIMLDGKHVTMYHYVMTEDFPYSVSCFRGASKVSSPVGGTPSGSGQGGQMMPQGGGSGGMGTPPAEATAACVGKTQGTACNFTGGRGESVSGMCMTPPSASSLACVPM